MLPDELPPIAVEPELLKELEALLYPGESIQNFMVSAVQDEVGRRLRLRESVGQGGPDNMPPQRD